MPGPQFLSPDECDQMDSEPVLLPGPEIIADGDLMPWARWFCVGAIR